MAPERLKSIEVVSRNILSRRRIFLLSLGLFALGVRHSFAAGSNADETFVQSTIDRSYHILNDGSLNSAQRQLNFRTLLLSVIDTKRIGFFTLGPYARGVTEDVSASFMASFNNFLAAVCQTGLERYKNETVRVTGSIERSRGDSIVHATVFHVNETAPLLNIALRVRSDVSGNHIITDLQLDGVWLAINHRADFASYLQQHNGSIAQLSAALDAQAKKLALAL